MADRVLVTGVSGFIGSHIAARLLGKGYEVRGTVRNVAKGKRIVEALAETGVDTSRLELVVADLGADAGWAGAVKDCRYIQHIASPLPEIEPENREALVPEARAGAQRVLERGLSAGVERIVMTSSITSMMGQPGKGRKLSLTEDSWSDPEWRAMTAFPVSKTRAELSAWAYVKAQKMESKLTVVNPGLVFGPDTYGNAAVSLGIIKMMLQGRVPRAVKVGYPIIDVRDCAAIHVAAMIAPEAAGRRLIASSQSLWMAEIAETLKAEYPELKKLPTVEFPNFIMRIIAIFDPGSKMYLPDLGTMHTADTAYVNSLTHVIPRPAKEAILASAKSLIDAGALKHA